MAAHIKCKIENARLLYQHRKIQVTKSLTYLQTQHNDCKQRAVEKLHAHFDRIQDVLDEYKSQREQELMDCLAKQELRTGQQCSHLEARLAKWRGDQDQLNSISSQDDDIIVFMTDIIDDLYTGLLEIKQEASAI